MEISFLSSSPFFSTLFNVALPFVSASFSQDCALFSTALVEDLTVPWASLSVRSVSAFACSKCSLIDSAASASWIEARRMAASSASTTVEALSVFERCVQVGEEGGVNPIKHEAQRLSHSLVSR